MFVRNVPLNVFAVTTEVVPDRGPVTTYRVLCLDYGARMVEPGDFEVIGGSYLFEGAIRSGRRRIVCPD